MAFEPANNFLRGAAKRFHLEPQLVGGLALQTAIQVIRTDYPSFIGTWLPKSFETHTLTIRATSSLASSQLYMRQDEFLQKIKDANIPVQIKEIKIIR